MITVIIMKKQNVQKHGWEYSRWGFSGGNSPGGWICWVGIFWVGFFQGEIFLIPFLHMENKLMSHSC